jgi:hypothetical protein
LIVADRILVITAISVIPHSYDEEDLRSKSQLKTKDRPIKEPAASLAPERTLTRKKKEIKGGLSQIQKRASVNITYYKEGKG